ncbi:MAG: deoxyribonuclease V [Chloroflexota bacterium]
MPKIPHRWDISPKEAISVQKKLAQNVIQQNQFDTVNLIAGIDMSIRNEVGKAAVVVFRYPEMTVVDYTTVTAPLTFPYIPGLFSFREGPVVIKALETLQIQPDLLIFDGQGIAHPRRFGLACHIGVLLDIPTIGCAKSRLCGHYQMPDEKRGAYSLLQDKNEVIGAVVRTRAATKPVFVSTGHRVDLQTSINFILETGGGYRLPEPTRWAHHVAGGKTPPGFALYTLELNEPRRFLEISANKN